MLFLLFSSVLNNGPLLCCAKTDYWRENEIDNLDKALLFADVSLQQTSLISGALSYL